MNALLVYQVIVVTLTSVVGVLILGEIAYNRLVKYMDERLANVVIGLWYVSAIVLALLLPYTFFNFRCV